MPSDLVRNGFPKNNTATALWTREENINHTYHGDYAVTGLTKCTIQFSLPEEMQPPVYFYYRLGNFYQNHRRYVASYFDRQLLGDAVTKDEVAVSSCEPLRLDDDMPIYPCGLIANSLFNDTFSNFTLLNSNQGQFNETYNMTSKGIAWESDKSLYGNTQITDYSSIVPPPNWQIQYRDGKYSNNAPPPNLHEDEHFMVWMRTAGLPTFSKLYAKNENDAMKIGDWSLDIIDSKRPLPLALTVKLYKQGLMI